MDDAVLSSMSRTKSNLEKIRNFRDYLESRISNLESEEKTHAYRVELRMKESEIFKSWLEDSLDKNINSMAELSTSALQHVIYDQKLQFKIKQEEKYNRVSMKFVLEEDSPIGVVEGDPLRSYGGGAAVIISLVLRLSIMTRLGMGNLLLLDESMVALANKYVPSAAQFMRQISEETGINILMVTHNPEFIAYAHTAYEGSKDVSLTLKRLKSESL